MSKTILKEVSAPDFVESCAKEFEKMEELKMPDWSRFAKTGSHRKFPPQRNDWWYVRAASIFRRVSIDGPVGVSRLRTYYGGRKERGHKPEKTVRASGNIIRKILQQLEKTSLIEKNKKGQRVISQKGNEFISKIIGEIKK